MFDISSVFQGTRARPGTLVLKRNDVIRITKKNSHFNVRNIGSLLYNRSYLRRQGLAASSSHQVIPVEFRTKEELSSIQDQMRHIRNRQLFFIGLTLRKPSVFAINVTNAHDFPHEWETSEEIPKYDIPWVAGQPSRKEAIEKREACTVAEVRAPGGEYGSNVNGGDDNANLGSGGGTKKAALWLYDKKCDKGASAIMCKMSILDRIGRKKEEDTDCPKLFRDLPHYPLTNSKVTPMSIQCYHLEMHKVSWHQAKNECELQNGTLATFETMSEWIHVKRHLYLRGGTGWIGGLEKIAETIEDGDGYREYNGQRVRWQWDYNNSIISMDRRWQAWWHDQPLVVKAQVAPRCVRVGTHRKTNEFGWWGQPCSKLQPYLCVRTIKRNR